MKKSGKESHSTSNKKVKNATPLTYDNIEFKSKLEVYCYKALKDNRIPVEYEKIKFQILDPFTYNEEKVRGMVFTPDFVGINFIIECKGFMNDAFPLRWKLFKYHLFTNKLRYILYLPRNKQDVELVVQDIISNYTRKIK
jgi:hypothetical protein